MKLYKTGLGIVILHKENFYFTEDDWDTMVNREYLYDWLLTELSSWKRISNGEEIISLEVRPPVGNQEVWAAGVTYLRSKNARMEESKNVGGGSFYDLVYNADRPELFFKSAPSKVIGTNDVLYIRRDSTWNAAEPELTLFINSAGSIEGYTIGNDMSSRSIEGENPLYLPQAKTYDRSAGLGPCLYVPPAPLPPETVIRMLIRRDQQEVYNDFLTISQMKRSQEELVEYLFREMTFPNGCYLMTGTCLVPEGDFTLLPGDEVEISIDAIGKLVNTIGMRP